MDINEPQEPPTPSLYLTISGYQGKEIDPIVAQAYEKFINDNFFVKSRAFAQFFWRLNIWIFEKTCEKIKVDQPNRPDSIIKEEVKLKFWSDFGQFTPKAERQIVK